MYQSQKVVCFNWSSSRPISFVWLEYEAAVCDAHSSLQYLKECEPYSLLLELHALPLNRWSTRLCCGIRSFSVEIRQCWTSGIYPLSMTSLTMEEDFCELLVLVVSNCKVHYTIMWFSGNEDVSLDLNWNIIPHAGLLPMIRSGSASIPFPTSYSTTPRQRKMWGSEWRHSRHTWHFMAVVYNIIMIAMSYYQS